MLNNSDKTWKYYGKEDPYYGVLTHEKFLKENIENNNNDFFQTGQQYVEEITKNINRFFLQDFTPSVSVDFGCGVGRLTIPFAEFSGEIYGVDISEDMLQEAKNNAKDKTNIHFVLSDDRLTQLPGEVDFIHSYIVFQHIPVTRGIQIAKILIDKLRPGGIGVLHFTYSIADDNPRWKRIANSLFKYIPFLYSLKSFGKKQKGPMMQMNEYSLNSITKMIQKAGVNEVILSLTEHNLYGAIFYFRK